MHIHAIVYIILFESLYQKDTIFCLDRTTFWPQLLIFYFQGLVYKHTHTHNLKTIKYLFVYDILCTHICTNFRKVFRTNTMQLSCSKLIYCFWKKKKMITESCRPSRLQSYKSYTTNSAFGSYLGLQTHLNIILLFRFTVFVNFWQSSCSVSLEGLSWSSLTDKCWPCYTYVYTSHTQRLLIVYYPVV